MKSFCREAFSAYLSPRRFFKFVENVRYAKGNEDWNFIALCRRRAKKRVIFFFFSRRRGGQMNNEQDEENNCQRRVIDRSFNDSTNNRLIAQCYDESRNLETQIYQDVQKSCCLCLTINVPTIIILLYCANCIASNFSSKMKKRVCSPSSRFIQIKSEMTSRLLSQTP